jgi:peptidyl-prolyl cis-trans isomerase D
LADKLSARQRADEAMFTAPPHPPPTTAKEITASHILIAYRGALHAPPGVTRTKDQAKVLAEQVAKLATAGADFGDLAVKYSDDPSVKQNFGNLGKFSRGQMEKPFSDAAFALIVMEITLEPVETALGFHIIRRTE